MTNSINITTVLWKGKFRGKFYTESDVNRLYRSLRVNVKMPYSFNLLTNYLDYDYPGSVFPLRHNWPGWWSKMELFRPDIPKPLLFIDLDSFVVGDLQHLTTYTQDAVMLPVKEKNRKKGWDQHNGRIYRYRSGMMFLKNNRFHWVYETFQRHAGQYMQTCRGDEDLLGDLLPEIPTFPYYAMSKFEAIKKRGSLYADTVVVTGDPRHGTFRDFTGAEWLKRMAYD